jgi:hypothetical protein
MNIKENCKQIEVIRRFEREYVLKTAFFGLISWYEKVNEKVISDTLVIAISKGTNIEEVEITKGDKQYKFKLD